MIHTGTSDPSAALRFDGLVAVVTGAGRGLGRSYATLLAGRGAAVVVNDNGCGLDALGGSPDPADETVAAIVANGGKSVASYESVASRAGAGRLVATAVDAFGALDIVVNNAGIQIILPVDATDQSVMQRHLDAHLLGSLYTAQAAWPLLLRSQSPRIVNTTSIGILGLEQYAAYASAKAAVLGLTRAIAFEARETPIRVNAIAPTAITRMVDAHFAVLAPGFEIPDEMRTSQPPELVAPMVAFLAHSSCQFTGEVLTAGGGRMSRLVLAETDGVLDAAPTPESVARQIGAIMDDESLMTLPDTMARSTALAALDH